MNDRFHPASLQTICATDLLRQYQSGATFFASPRRSLLAHGIKAVLPPCENSQLAAMAAEYLKNVQVEGQPAPVLIGALPFRMDAGSPPAHLFVPQQLISGAGVDDMMMLKVPAKPIKARALTAAVMQPTPVAYRDNVRSALAQIKSVVFEKTVLSRSLRLDVQINIPDLLQRLAARNLRGYTFAIDLAGDGATQMPERRTLIGASPELLLARHGRELISHPLAGSIPRSDDAMEDSRRAEGLLRSAKDLHEHALVVNAVAAVMRPYCKVLQVPATPSLLATPTMWHLGTEIRGELADLATTSLEVALALHPTPAVCGHPTAPARQFIADTEGFDRRYFAGLVGWCDSHGDGEWAVTLRCAEVGANHATLYAGAGIVAGSDSQLELLETSAKLRTMLAAMNLELMLEDREDSAEVAA